MRNSLIVGQRLTISDLRSTERLLALNLERANEQGGATLDKSYETNGDAS